MADKTEEIDENAKDIILNLEVAGDNGKTMSSEEISDSDLSEHNESQGDPSEAELANQEILNSTITADESDDDNLLKLPIWSHFLNT